MANTNKGQMDKQEIAPVVTEIEDIGSLVYVIRGKQVMLDSDLAVLYGYEVPESLRSQFATLNEEGNRRGTHRKYLPSAKCGILSYRINRL